MNIQFSNSHRKQTAKPRHVKETTALTACASRIQKQRQSEQSKVKTVLHRKRLAPRLTQAEQVSSLRRQALTEAKQGHYVEAIALFSQLVEQEAATACDYNNRGLAYFQIGQAEAAIADYDTALALNPRLDSAYNNRANYYAAQGQLLEAVMDYDMAVDLNPSNVRARINQGITFRDLEMYDLALDCFDFALHFGQLEGHIYAERGRTYHLWGDWNCAIADYERALLRLPESTTARAGASVRLRLQVEGWIHDLLDPLR